MKDTNKGYGVVMTIRMTLEDYAKIKRACYRDEMKVSTFARAELMKSAEKLLKRQEIHGYQCDTPL